MNSVEVDGKQLIASTPEYANFKVERTENFYKVTGEAIVEYYPNPVYVYKINGTVCNGASSDCIFVGYGLISKFNDAKLPQPSFKFSISSNNNKVIKNSSSTCKYTVEPEIIKYPNSNGNLDLEFRLIDTNCPFPTRDTNSNWCLNGDCSSNNALVTSVIKDRNNSYNKTGGNPKYKITLTPSDVLLIRKFNKEISYDNYEIYCDNNGICSNAFVYDLKSGSINKYENNKIIKNYGSLVYKLET